MPSHRTRPSPAYRAFVGCLVLFLVLGLFAYGQQNRYGLSVTGLSRAVPWGLYISQFTFMVGVAASSVLVVLPRYVHGKADTARLVVVGEAISVAALTAAVTFVLVDLGRPSRVLAVLLNPQPTSLMFWDIMTLTGYFVLCATILGAALLTPPGSHANWTKPLVFLSIPFAIGIHVVTALLYAGLSARAGWMTAILAPKFLATAFASGSALLLLIASLLNAKKSIGIEESALDRLAAIMTYALAAVLLFTGLEVFTAAYSGSPAGAQHVAHLFVPGAHSSGMMLAMLASVGLAIVAFVILLWPALRRKRSVVYFACGAVIASVYIEKGFVFIPSGFFPTPLGEAASYSPSLLELLIALGVQSGAALVFLTLLHFILAHSADTPSARASASSVIGGAGSHTQPEARSEQPQTAA